MARNPHDEGAEIARTLTRPGGGMVANLMALIALMFSGYSFWETVLKADALRVFTAPTIGFSDPFNGPFDVFELPVTIANNGARAGVALSFALDVENPRTGEIKRYRATGLGAWRDAARGERTPFAPISIPGREAVTQRILFTPAPGETIDRHVEVEGGVFRFRLSMEATPVARLPVPLDVAERPPQVIEFDMIIDGLDYRAFNDGGVLDFRRPEHGETAPPPAE